MSSESTPMEDDPGGSSGEIKRFGPTPAGEMVTLYAGRDETDGRYDFVVSTVEPGSAVVPLHVHHEHDEAIYVIEGEIEARVGDEAKRLTPGSFLMMPASIPHTWRNAAAEPSRFVCLFSPGGHVGVLEELAQLEASEVEPGPESFAPILNRYDIEIVGPPPGKA